MKNKNFKNKRRLHDIVAKMNETLVIMERQNLDLVDINNRLVEEISSNEKSFNAKVNNLAGLMAEVIENPESNITLKYRSYIAELEEEYPNLQTIARKCIYSNEHTNDDYYINQSLNVMSVIDKINMVNMNFKSPLQEPQLITDVMKNLQNVKMDVSERKQSLDLYSIPSPVNNHICLRNRYESSYFKTEDIHANNSSEFNNILLIQSDDQNNSKIYNAFDSFQSDSHNETDENVCYLNDFMEF